MKFVKLRETVTPEMSAKAALLSYLRVRGSLRRAAIATELGVQRLTNRADVVLVGKNLCCFEIKTREDKLVRLDRQLDAYSRCFNEVTVVAASKHVNAVLSRIPEHVGLFEIVQIGGTLDVRPVRSALESPLLEIEGLVGFLPAREMRPLIPVGVKLRNRAETVNYVKATQDLSKVHSAVRRYLISKHRDATREFLTATARSGISPPHTSLLSLRRQNARSTEFEAASDFCAERALYSVIGKSFGPVPDEIRQLMAELNQPTALPPAQRHLRQNGPVDVDEY